MTAETNMTERQMERFWTYVAIGPPTECWPWKGARNNLRGGYGAWGFQIAGRLHHRRAHRVAYMLTFGEIPPGLSICHHCDNPPCCNPAHLFLGTVRDNNFDMWNKGRGKISPPRGETHHSAKLTQADVDWIRSEHALTGRRTQIYARYPEMSRSAIGAVIDGRSWSRPSRYTAGIEVSVW